MYLQLQTTPLRFPVQWELWWCQHLQSHIFYFKSSTNCVFHHQDPCQWYTLNQKLSAFHEHWINKSACFFLGAAHCSLSACFSVPTLVSHHNTILCKVPAEMYTYQDQNASPNSFECRKMIHAAPITLSMSTGIILEGVFVAIVLFFEHRDKFAGPLEASWLYLNMETFCCS